MTSNIPEQLKVAFELSGEEYGGLFERFANAFLLEEYPELSAIGGKHDKGMDARVIADDNGRTTLVVQSCVSPAQASRNKIKDTLKKLSPDLPGIFVYCTTAQIGVRLDSLKSELRVKERVTLEVKDGPWFVQRAITTESRRDLSKAFCDTVLQSVRGAVDPGRLLSPALSASEERVIARYIEAHNYDRTRGHNLTRQVFDALILYAMRDSDIGDPLLTVDEIVEAVAKPLPSSHLVRINQIVPQRLDNLVASGRRNRSHPGEQ